MATDIKTRLHEQFGPNASPDFDIFVGAMGDMLLQEIENYVSEQDDGAPGWSPLFDVDAIPDKGLPWLAQFIGVRLPPGLTPAQQRTRIETTDGWNRGTLAAMRGAILPFLTGAQTVYFYERDSSPYHFTVITRTSESGDATNQAKILAALTEQKPAGLQFTYLVQAGQEYSLVFSGFATYQTVFTTYATYNGLLNAVPGT